MKRPRMPHVVRHTLVSTRDLLATAGPFLLLTLLLLVAAYWLLDPAPPRRMVLATGGERGAYAEFGARYATLLAKEGIQVELRFTQGAVENLALLRDPLSGVDVAFVQGGVDAPGLVADDSSNVGLTSLGSLFYEPVWLFYREDAAKRPEGADPDALAELPGLRMNAGTDGSGVPRLVQQSVRGQRHRPARADAVAAGTDAGGDGLSRGRASTPSCSRRRPSR